MMGKLLLKFLNLGVKGKLLTSLIIALCFCAGIASVIKTGGANPVEQVVDVVLSKQLGVTIDISHMMEGNKEKL